MEEKHAVATDELILALVAGGLRQERAFRQLELQYCGPLADRSNGLQTYSMLLAVMAQTKSWPVHEAFVNRFYNHLHPGVREDLERQLRSAGV